MIFDPRERASKLVRTDIRKAVFRNKEKHETRAVSVLFAFFFLLNACATETDVNVHLYVVASGRIHTNPSLSPSIARWETSLHLEL